MSRRVLALLWAVTGGGCCSDVAPTWQPLDPLVVAPDERVEVDLGAWVTDDGPLEFAVSASPGVLATVEDGSLVLVAEQGFLGATEVALTATDGCDHARTATLPVEVSADGGTVTADCLTHLRYADRTGADAVYVAGSFNGWDPRATPMVEADGVWTADLALSPGNHTYKYVEVSLTDGTEGWSCDPDADYTQCDEGYSWDPTCPVGGPSCNSLIVVPACGPPVLTVTRLDVDRDANTVAIEVAVEGELSAPVVIVDGELAAGWTGTGFSLSLSGLSEGRHTFRFAGSGPGGVAEPVYVPVWLDDTEWRRGVMYYVFVDRFADGDASLDASEGTSAESTDYLGGDWQGVIDHLDDLADLGVTVLWLTSPQDNAAGAWDGSCGATYSGYHGYWPSDAFATEGHFGDAATLHTLVDEAHARGMRVLTDWVANHVHVDHPYYSQHPEWFNPLAVCGDADNWNDIPETCWFDDYLPDIRYYDADPLVQMVDDAMAWVEEYELDGFRVDAVKHMPHSVYFNLASRVRNEVEYRAVGDGEDFYTVGETYSGDRDLIGSYVNAQELDGQFDFPVYWAIVAAFARNEIGLSNGDGSLEDTFADSEAAFAGHLMSTFLGNHDVARFLAQASGEIGSLYGDSACGDDGQLRTPDVGTDDPTPYARLRLAWTFLLTSEGLPLIYYGDEIGLPGYNDPDNRQRMKWGDALSPNEAATLAHVQALGRARRDHPAFSTGVRTGWWEGEADVYAYARVADGDQVLVLLNRGGSERTLENGLAFAGLTATSWEDVLTGDAYTAAGDRLSVTIPARASRVLVPR